MKAADLVSIRKRAEESVYDMPEGPLKVAAFREILKALLATPTAIPRAQEAPSRALLEENVEVPSSLGARIGMLGREDFFSQPRSLAEIQSSLAEHGWHYAQSSLSTPLIRLVRQRQLRRLQVAEGKKRVWKYSLP